MLGIARVDVLLYSYVCASAFVWLSCAATAEHVWAAPTAVSALLVVSCSPLGQIAAGNLFFGLLVLSMRAAQRLVFGRQPSSLSLTRARRHARVHGALSASAPRPAAGYGSPRRIDCGSA
jgi:hypothetical protein